MRRRISPIWAIKKEDLIGIIERSQSINDVLKHFSLINKGCNYKTLYTRCKEDNISLEELKYRQINKQQTHIKDLSKNKKIPINEILIEHSNFPRTSLKKRLIKEKLLEYKCKKCNNKGEWNGKKLSLQLEHINGISDDNRLENLCFLCPNCHSQTETFSGKQHRKHHQRECPICHKKISTRATYCRKCASRKYSINKRKFEISQKELEELINSKISLLQIGKMYNVSDNAIRKRCEFFGINYRNRGLVQRKNIRL
jgi:Zn finger protein HypA/HybF involved in hydrogenase expression